MISVEMFSGHCNLSRANEKNEGCIGLHFPVQIRLADVNNRKNETFRRGVHFSAVIELK